jgi:hypothetical protein
MAQLTQKRLKQIERRINPSMFLQRFSKQLEEDGEEILRNLFAIAKGNTQQMQDGSWVARGDPKDAISAIKVILEMGAFKEVVKHLLKVSQKGRPEVDGEEEAWVAEYGDIDDREASAPKKAKGPPKKGS